MLHFICSSDRTGNLVEFVFGLLDNPEEIDINAKTRAGLTPLMIACKMHNEGAVSSLCKREADVLCENQLGLTARNYLLGFPEIEELKQEQSSILKIINAASDKMKHKARMDSRDLQPAPPPDPRFDEWTLVKRVQIEKVEKKDDV